jgi:hypothetical protein
VRGESYVLYCVSNSSFESDTNHTWNNRCTLPSKAIHSTRSKIPHSSRASSLWSRVIIVFKIVQWYQDDVSSDWPNECTSLVCISIYRSNEGVHSGHVVDGALGANNQHQKTPIH